MRGRVPLSFTPFAISVRTLRESIRARVRRRADHLLAEGDEEADALRDVLAGERRAGDVLDVGAEAQVADVVRPRELLPPRRVAHLPAVALAIGHDLGRAQRPIG